MPVELLISVVALAIALTDFPTAVVKLLTATVELVTLIYRTVSETKGRRHKNEEGRQ